MDGSRALWTDLNNLHTIIIEKGRAILHEDQ